MSFLNGLYQSTDIQLSGVDSVNTTYGDSIFYLTSSLGENFVIYVDGTSVFVLNSSTGVLTISSPINITSTFSVNGYPTVFSFLSGSPSTNLNTGTAPFPSITTATNNTAYGVEAMNLVTTGTSNTAVGFRALKSLTTGGSNTACGNFSLENVTSGILNLGFGYLAGNKMVSSIVATCLGYSAGNSGFQGDYINLIGNSSYVASAGLSNSTCLGGASFIDANNQIAIGISTDTIIIRGNTGVTKTDNTNKVASTSIVNTLISRLLYLNTTSGNQIFYDVQFPALTTGYRNIGIGDCFRAITSGGDNCCVGSGSMNALTTGTENFCLGGLSLRALSTGSFNVSVGVQNLANTNGSGNIAIGRYVMGGGSGGDNTGIGYFSTVQITTGNSNTGVGAYSHYQLQSGSNNTALGVSAGGHAGGSLINASNNTYVGSGAQMSGGTTYTNSTCLGYNSRITASNSIFLGTASETTYAMGGLNIPSGQTLTIVGGLTFNGTAVNTAIVDTGTANQSITARKDFDGFDNTIPNYCGSSFVSPVFRPRLYSLFDSINNSCHAFGSNSARNLQVDVTNSAVYCLGQDNLDAKTLNCKNVTSIGGGSMRAFTSESFNFVTVLGQGHLPTESGFPMTNVTMIGSNTTFTNGAIKPTSVTNALFNNAYGMTLASAVAISNVFGIRTSQPITKSNQGIIGDSTEITLHSTGQKVIVTGSLQVQQSFQSSIFSPQINYATTNYTIATPLLQYYHLVVNAATTITLPVVTSAMVGQEFTFKRRGGNTSVVSVQTTTSGGALQPIFSIGGNLGITTFPTTMLSAVQSVAKFMAIQSHFAGSGTGSCPGSSTTLTISTWGTLPSAFITIGTRVTLSGFTKTITAYGTGTGGTGTYTVDSIFGVGAVSGAVTSADCFGYDILQIQ